MFGRGIFFMNKEIICGIYMIYWDNNDYFYYGQALHFYSRKSCHIHAFKNKKHRNRKLQNIFNKYGTPNFFLVERCEERELDELEQSYIDFWIRNKYCCNLSPCATSNKGIKLSDKIKSRFSQIQKEWHKHNISPLLGFKHTMESRENNRNSKLGKRASIKTRELMSYKHSGEKNGFYGKKHSQEVIEHLRNINLGRKVSDEVNKKKGLPRDKNPFAKLVLNTENGIYYGCVKDAEDSLSLPCGFLARRLRGDRKNKTSFIYA